MQISKRLAAVADMVTPGNALADVGTDHGYIPIYLAEKGRIPSAVAMDVNRGPLERAREHIRQYGLEGRIETRLSDGLDALAPGEADSILIAGMGGTLTVRILKRGADRILEDTELILQPQSDTPLVRHYLETEGYQIQQEEIILEEGKFYPMMRAAKRKAGKSAESMTREEFFCGPLLLAAHHPVLKKYLERELYQRERVAAHLQCEGGDASKRRLEEVEEMIRMLRSLLSSF